MIQRDALTQAIVECSLDAVITVDEQGLLIDFNPAAERMFGYQRDDVLGRSISTLIVPPELRQRHENGMARYLRTGVPSILGDRVEIDGMRADGARVPVELTVTEVWLDGQRLFTASLRDLSERVSAEAEIARQRERLAQSEKLNALGSLLASVAHELNNPLSVLVGQAELLSQTVSDSTLGRRVERIHRAAERCASIVRSFLVMARSQEPKRERTSLVRLAREALELMEYSLSASDVRVRLLAEADPAVELDPTQIAQVLTNLVVNAQQALVDRDDPRTLDVIVREPDAATVEVVVEDNGPGISPELRERVFEPFFTTKPEGVGTGIGLSVTRGIVDAHDGELVVESPAAGGTRFRVRLPIIRDHRDTTPATTAVAATGDGLQVLVAEDEPEIAELLGDVLRSKGHRALIASSGREALELLRRHEVDAVISDLRMRDMDGPALYDALVHQSPAIASRIGFITGDTLSDASIRFLRRAGRPYRAKPFRAADILSLLDEL